MQQYGISPPNAPLKDGETTLKVSRTIHAEMIREFARFGFSTLGQYTDYILTHRQQIMQENTTNPPVQPPTLTAQELGTVLDASQPWQQVHQPPKQPGIFVSNEDYYVLKSNEEAFRKEREERVRLQQTVQSLSNALDVLVDEAAARSGSVWKKYNNAYFEAIVLQSLQQEGVRL